MIYYSIYVIKLFKIKFSNDIYGPLIKERPKEKPMARKKLDIILLYIENILEGENILKMWTKQFGSHEGDDYVLIVTKESSKSYADKFLRRMWQYLKLFNIFIIDINEFKHEKIQSQVQFYLHNPYRKTGENFQEYEFNETDIDEKSQLIFKDILLRVMDLNEYPLNVMIHDFTGLTGPILDKNNKTISFKGKVGKVVKEYAQVMNFTPVYVTPKKQEINENPLETTPTSSLDYSDNIDLYGNYRIVLYDPTSNVRYLKTLQQVRVVVVVPSAIPECRSIGTPLEALDRWGRVFALSFVSLLTILWTIVRTKISSKCCSVWNNFVIVLMNCIRITHFSTIKMPDSRWEKFIFIILTVWIFFIGNSFTGTIVTRLAVTNSQETNTLKELAETDFMIANMNSTQRVLVRGLSTMNSEEAEIRKKLFNRQFIVSDPAGIWEKSALTRTFAVICPEYISRSIVQQYYDKKDGRDLFHEMKETVSMMYSAQVIPKSSPLAKSFEYVQDIFFQAGFLKYWQEEEDYQIIIKKMHRVIESDSGQRKLNLENLQTTFTLWALMLAAATIVFLLELLISEASSDNSIF